MTQSFLGTFGNLENYFNPLNVSNKLEYQYYFKFKKLFSLHLTRIHKKPFEVAFVKWQNLTFCNLLRT